MKSDTQPPVVQDRIEIRRIAATMHFQGSLSSEFTRFIFDNA